MSERIPTIWEALALKLVRQPTNAEACADVKRILSEATVERATIGALSWQRKR